MRKNKLIKARTKNHSLGFFSGTPTHNNDFKIAAPAISQFLNENSDFKLKIVGHLDLGGIDFNYDHKKIEWIPIQSPINYLRIVSKVDFQINPLQNNDFTNAKSELKFFEAAAVKTITLASPTYSFKESINDGIDGYLVDDLDWYDKLNSLKSINLLKKAEIQNAARGNCMDNFLGREQVKFYSNLILNLIN